MSGPLDTPANARDTLVTRALVTALGQALVKNGVISHSEVASELSGMIQATTADAELHVEMKRLLGIVLTWGT